MSYNRYRKFMGDGKVRKVPRIRIPMKGSDYFETYNCGVSRLDLISYQYYKDPNYDWLIMLANPEYGSLEFQIPNGATLRIPYPLEQSLSDYENEIDKYNLLYGIR